MLIVLEDLGTHYRNNYKKRKFRKWKVQCPICGKVFEIFQNYKRNSCSECGNKEAGRKREKHGLYKHRLMSIYNSMKQRCYNPNHKRYYCYGAIGVTICDEWKNSFKSFANWALSNGYEEHLTLDKDELCKQLNISPKIYSPQTCKWIPKHLNSSTNKRNSSISKLSYEQVKEIQNLYNTKVYGAAQLAKMFNVHISTIHYNLKRTLSID